VTKQKTIATIDIGSNSIKLLVARLDPHDPAHYEEVLREKDMVRLGQETLETGVLSEEAIAAGVDCLVRYTDLARAAGAQTITAVATCAVREAENADVFVEEVRRATGVTVAVISGEEEARLITRAVRGDLPPTADPFLVIDIGGGSTEVVVAKEDRILLEDSLDLGAVRLTDRYVKSDPLAPGDFRRLVKVIRGRVERLGRQVRKSKFKTAVGTSGTILALADLAAARAGAPLTGSGHRPVSLKEVKRITRLLRSTSAKERERIPALDPDRADIITAGAVLLAELMEAFGVETLVPSDRSLREGLVLDPVSPGGSAPRDIRRASVLRLEKKHGTGDHAHVVRDLALSLFDQTNSLHQLGPKEREWLEYAATLHDLGLSIAYSRHHHHSYYLILHGAMKGFTRDEVELIALVARYHRKSGPKASHEEFRRLDPWKKPVVEKLAALLRVADGLDRTHRNLVTNVRVSSRGKRIQLVVSASGACDLELWAARKKAGVFERVFCKKLVLRFVAAGAKRSPAAAPRRRRRAPFVLLRGGASGA
jgi:exopolyphosphatase / guanosine-5'-triphosphate,3'-diphosphate pyrophosphatase